jgi:branched-chain amino acid transport system ATP-binding protein
MDEPAAGLDTEETRRLGVIIRRIADEGTPILLVEHDMALVREISDRVYVLNFGALIASGSVTTVYQDPMVAAAYLGESIKTPAGEIHSDDVADGGSHAMTEKTP